MWLPSSSLCYSFILALEVTDTVMTTMTEDLLHFVVMRDVLLEVGQSFIQLVSEQSGIHGEPGAKTHNKRPTL